MEARPGAAIVPARFYNEGGRLFLAGKIIRERVSIIGFSFYSTIGLIASAGGKAVIFYWNAE